MQSEVRHSMPRTTYPGWDITRAWSWDSLLEAHTGSRGCCVNSSNIRCVSAQASSPSGEICLHITSTDADTGKGRPMTAFGSGATSITGGTSGWLLSSFGRDFPALDGFVDGSVGEDNE